MNDSNILINWHKERVKNWKWYFERIAEMVVKEYNPKTLLDVGCSDGLLLECFYNYGVECFGVDISKKALSFAPKKFNLCSVDIEKENLPFKDEVFDFVTILEVLEHLRDHRKIISEIYRVLKPSGVVMMSTPVDSKMYQILSKIANKVMSKEGVIRDFDVCDFSPHINVHGKRFWIKEFTAAGFDLLEDFKKNNRDLIKKVIKMHEPKDSIAKILVKFPFGRGLRAALAYHLWSTTLLFVKQV